MDYVKIRRLVTVAILAALVVVLQLLGNLFGFMNNIALGLIPIAIGAILYGPGVGAFLGLAMSIVIVLHPANYSLMGNGFDIFKLVVIILIKTPLAGFSCGMIYKLLSSFASRCKTKAKQITGTIFSIGFSSIFVCIVNTLSYFLLMLAFFSSGTFLTSGNNSFTLEAFNNIENLGISYTNTAVMIILAFIGFNFIIELAMMFVVTPAIVSIIKVATRNYNLGFKNDFSIFQQGEVA